MPLLQKSRSRAVVDVAALLDDSAREYLVSLVASGCMVALFRTRDGGALGCQVTLDGESEKEYFRTPEEFSDWLGEVDKAVAAAPAAPPPSTRARKGLSVAT